jgi:hypothetical protein
MFRVKTVTGSVSLVAYCQLFPVSSGNQVEFSEGWEGVLSLRAKKGMLSSKKIANNFILFSP